jgi:hypothetical protein
MNVHKTIVIQDAVLELLEEKKMALGPLVRGLLDEWYKDNKNMKTVVTKQIDSEQCEPVIELPSGRQPYEVGITPEVYKCIMCDEQATQYFYQRAINWPVCDEHNPDINPQPWLARVNLRINVSMHDGTEIIKKVDEVNNGLRSKC